MGPDEASIGTLAVLAKYRVMSPSTTLAQSRTVPRCLRENHKERTPEIAVTPITTRSAAVWTAVADGPNAMTPPKDPPAIPSRPHPAASKSRGGAQHNLTRSSSCANSRTVTSTITSSDTGLHARGRPERTCAPTEDAGVLALSVSKDRTPIRLDQTQRYSCKKSKMATRSTSKRDHRHHWHASGEGPSFVWSSFVDIGVEIPVIRPATRAGLQSYFGVDDSLRCRHLGIRKFQSLPPCRLCWSSIKNRPQQLERRDATRS